MRVDPSASAACWYEPGTARSASSETEKTIGQMAKDEAEPRDERVQSVLGAEDALHPGRQDDEREKADDDRGDRPREARWPA